MENETDALKRRIEELEQYRLWMADEILRLEANQREEWQPIKTAPLDVVILVYPPTYNSCTASMARFEADKYAVKPRPYWRRLDAYGVLDSRNNPPTHWQPLPQPPTKG